MGTTDDGLTNPRLLERLGDWRDDPAWREFVARYDPLLRRWCRQFRLDGAASDDLCQRVWIELSRRMRGFRYDPGRTFRGWLWRLFRSRAIDFLRERQADGPRSLDAGPVEAAGRLVVGPDEPGEAPGAARLAMLRQGEQVQAAVRRRVEAETWHAFWLIEVEGRTVREAADQLGKTYAAAFRAHQRVRRMLGDEGRRHLAGLPDANAPLRSPGVTP